jgi:hypothetical protein
VLSCACHGGQHILLWLLLMLLLLQVQVKNGWTHGLLLLLVVLLVVLQALVAC